MKIVEAIETLKTTGNRDITPASQGYRDAIKLGIEALKRVKKSRDKRFPVQGELLPGETEE